MISVHATVGDSRGSHLVKATEGESLCPDCGWCCLWMQLSGVLRCESCWWVGMPHEAGATVAQRLRVSDEVAAMREP